MKGPHGRDRNIKRSGATLIGGSWGHFLRSTKATIFKGEGDIEKGDRVTFTVKLGNPHEEDDLLIKSGPRRNNV